MNAQDECARCGVTIPADVPAAQCPNCLLALGLGMLGAPSTARPGPMLGELPGTQAGGALHFRGGPNLYCFNDYELLEEIARGGMGVVYKARQVSLNRLVAVKMILSGQFASKQEVLRFRAEAETAASLRHPNIVAIYETGEHDGRHYFSMDYVQGRHLGEMVHEGPLESRRAARYVKIIAEAIQYAHEQGMLHRDLKPSNVLIDSNDQPRVTDFGLAKRVRGDFGLTVSGQALGSPNFMPPEQTGARSAKVGPWSDVYGLGAILYHLVTGRPPFQAETIDAVLWQLRDQEPASPRLLNPSVPRDLETICLKCLEKDPARRYQSASALSEELDRFLEGEPIQARPLGRVARVWRWSRRRPLLAILTGATASLCIAFAIGAPIALYRINQEKRMAQAEALARRLQLYAAEMKLAGQTLEDGDRTRALTLLKKHIPSPGQTNDLRGFEWRYLFGQCRGDEWATLGGRQNRPVHAVRFSPLGTLLAAQDEDGIVKLWDYRTQNLVATLGEKTDKIAARPEDESPLAFSPDGRLLASGAGTNIRIWNMDSLTLEAVISGLASRVNFLVFAPDGKTLVTCGDEVTLSLWDMREGQPSRLASLPTGLGRPARAAFSFDGKILAASGNDLAIVRWNIADLENIRPLAPLVQHTGWVGSLVFSPRENRLFSGGAGGAVIAWNCDFEGQNCTWRKLPIPQGSIGIVYTLAMTPGGERLIAAGSDANVTVWELLGDNDQIQLKGHGGPILSLDISPDGRTCASSSRDNTVKLWDLASLRQKTVPLPRISYNRSVTAVSFSPDSKRVVSMAGNSRIDNAGAGLKLWNAANQELLVERDVAGLGKSQLAFSPDGRVLATVEGGMIRLRASHSLEEFVSFPGRCPVFVPSGAELVYFSRQSGKGEIHWRSLETQKVRIWKTDWPFVQSLVVGRDGRRVAAAVGNRVMLQDASSPEGAIEVGRHNDFVWSLALSSRGDLLASAGWDGSVRLWNLDKPREQIPPLIAHNGFAWAVAFSPDGKTIATGGDDATVKLWNLASLQEAAVLHGHSGHINDLAFSEDGEQLASSSADGTVRIWRAPRMEAITAAIKLEDQEK